jgi:hypothetical protein
MVLQVEQSTRKLQLLYYHYIIVQRLTGPQTKEELLLGSDLDSAVTKELNKNCWNSGKQIVLLSGTEISPSTLDILKDSRLSMAEKHTTQCLRLKWL